MFDGNRSPCLPADLPATTGPVGTLVLDWNLEIIGADPGACRLLERESEQIVGRSCLELMTPPQRARAAFDALRAGPEATCSDRFNFIRLGGDGLHAQVQMHSATAASGLCIVLTVQDRERRAVRRVNLNQR